MGKYIPAIATGLVVALLLALGLNKLAAASGQSPSLSTWLPPIIFGTIVAYVMANLVGTKLAKAATAADKAAALELRPEPGQALLIVLREGFVGKAAGLNIALDDRVFAQLKSPRFTALSITPGPHKASASFGGLAAAQSKAATEDFTAAPGEVVAFRVLLSMGMVQNTVKMERVPAPQSLVPKLKAMPMIAPTA